MSRSSAKPSYAEIARKPEFVFDFLREPLRIGLEHFRPEMLEDRDARTNLGNDPSGVVPSEMIDVHLVAEPQNVDDQHVGPEARIVACQTVEKSAAGQIRDAQTFVRKVHSVRAYRVDVGDRRSQLHAADAVRPGAGFEPLEVRDETPDVRQHHRFDVERIGGREERAAAAKSTRGHRFDERVDVAGVIQMLVGKHDRIELPRIARRNVRERAHQRAGTGIDVNLGLAKTHPHAAGSAQLPRDDEPSAAAAKKQHRGSLPDFRSFPYAPFRPLEGLTPAFVEP